MTEPRRSNFVTAQGLVQWIDPAEVDLYPMSGRWANLLAPVAETYSTDDEYYDDLVLLGNSVDAERPYFIRLFERRDSIETAASVLVLKGRVGIGKSSFLKWWRNGSRRTKYCAWLDLNHDGISHAGDNHSLNEAFARHLVEDLLPKVDSNQRFRDELSRLIEPLHSQSRTSMDREQFEEYFVNQSAEFTETYPAFGPELLLATVIVAINNVFRHPVWLLVDNIDLESAELQAQYSKAAFGCANQVREHAANRDWVAVCHLIVAARPETIRSHGFHFNQYEDVTYPDPD